MVAEAVVQLDGAPVGADGGEPDVIGEREALQDLFC